MKILLADGKTSVECSAEEFQAIYPTLLNGHARKRTTSEYVKETPMTESEFSAMIESLRMHYQTEPFHVRTAAKQLKVPYWALYRAVWLAIKDGVIEKKGERAFKFTNHVPVTQPESGDSNHKQNAVKQDKRRKEIATGKELTLHTFVEILRQHAGAYEFTYDSLKTLFQDEKLDRTQVNALLRQALVEGMIEQQGNWYRIVQPKPFTVKQ